jgi:hypothetical protein
LIPPARDYTGIKMWNLHIDLQGNET